MRNKTTRIADPEFLGLAAKLNDELATAARLVKPSLIGLYEATAMVPIMADWLDEHGQALRAWALRWLYTQRRVPKLSGRSAHVLYWHWAKQLNRRALRPHDLPFFQLRGGIDTAYASSARWGPDVKLWYRAHRSPTAAFLAAADEKVSLRLDVAQAQGD